MSAATERAGFARVVGWTIAFLVVVEAVTGAALAAFYSPSTTSAWASVAYIQDRSTWGWLVRGIHHHGGGAIAIASGLHLVEAAVRGTYRGGRARTLAWWVGIGVMVALLAWAVTGYVLPWDQGGYWANRVEVGIAAGTPVVGDQIRSLALGGNDYGNLTLTRFTMLHLVALPALVTGGIVLHVRLARRAAAGARELRQRVFDLVAMLVAFGLLVGYTVARGGAPLLGPADPSQAFDARPLWYFRWLYELRTLAGSAEKLVAMAAPAIVGGLLAAVPMVDRDGAPRGRRRLALAAVALVGATVTGLTIASLVRDAGDAPHAEAMAKAETAAARARTLATKYGVPTSGALDVFLAPPLARARALYGARCASCHDAASKDRKGPAIGPGYGSRAWVRAFLLAPSAPEHFGRTALAKTDAAMKPVDERGAELDDLVEAVYAETGAPDADPAKRDRGRAHFDKVCSDCHTRTPHVESAAAPNLAGWGSHDYFIEFVGDPKSTVHMGPTGEMPGFAGELSVVDRDAIAGYLDWLRTATPADLAALD